MVERSEKAKWNDNYQLIPDRPIYIVSTLQHIGCDQGEGTVSNTVLANVINEAFLAPMSHFAPLQTEEFVPNSPVFEGCCLQVSEFSVNKKLSTLNPTKATGHDGIPSCLLKDNADIFAAPVSNILNRSFLEARLPSSWKLANISPIPKQKPIHDVNSHLRPISLTPILSKVAEDFVVEEFVKPAVLKKVDPNQFGTIPGIVTPPRP